MEVTDDGEEVDNVAEGDDDVEGEEDGDGVMEGALKRGDNDEEDGDEEWEVDARMVLEVENDGVAQEGENGGGVHDYAVDDVVEPADDRDREVVLAEVEEDDDARRCCQEG